MSLAKLSPLPLLVLLVCSIAGCFSAEDGAQVQKDVEELKRKVAEQGQRAEQERRRLQKVMEQATALLARNSADVGAQVERIGNRSDKVSGRMEELQQEIKQLTQIIGQLRKPENSAEARQGGDMPVGANALFSSATNKMSVGEQAAARQLLRRFLSQHASDPRAAKAQRLLGDSYFVAQKFPQAVVEYRKVLKEHKDDRAEAALALYKIGMAFYQLKWCSDAGSFLQQFTRENRGHPMISNARKLLKLIKRYRRNRQFCSS